MSFQIFISGVAFGMNAAWAVESFHSGDFGGGISNIIYGLSVACCAWVESRRKDGAR